MNDAVRAMLNRYLCKSADDYENALKEIIQEISLLGLWRSKFFEKASFYGGSALRILYGLDRFSEDLDFSLLRPNKNFSLQGSCRAIEEELKSFGFNVAVEEKPEKSASNIESAFIKAGTLQNMIIVEVPGPIRKKIHKRAGMKVKLEVDKDPPGGFLTETKYLFQPIPFSVNVYTLSHLFAGKLHALLCRPWISRIKGRDWYDLVWYVGRNISVNLGHLEKRMKQTKHLKKGEVLTRDVLKEKLVQKIDTVNFSDAKNDVAHLLKDQASLKLWSQEYFKSVCEQIITE